jgi:hypothetical protein
MSLGGRPRLLSMFRSRSLVLWLFPTLGRDTGIAGRVDSYEWVERGEAATISFGRSGHTRQGSVSGGCGCRDDCGVLGRRVAGRLEVVNRWSKRFVCRESNSRCWLLAFLWLEKRRPRGGTHAEPHGRKALGSMRPGPCKPAEPRERHSTNATFPLFLSSPTFSSISSRSLSLAPESG